MNQSDWLAEQFEAHRAHLRSVAYRMLGSVSDADDAVQEGWLRLSRSDTSEIENLGGWLTTVVARVCLDMLRSRKSRKEEQLGDHAPEPVLGMQDGTNPEHEALLAESVGLAMLVVLDTLMPAERVAFVLHDMFGVPFDEIAPIVGRSSMATRQLASRARRRVRGVSPESKADPSRGREIVEAFLAASRGGDFGALLALLDPNVVLRADHVAVQMAAANRASGAPNLSSEIRGSEDVADVFSGSARFARPALINGAIGAVWAPGGKPRSVFDISIANGKIVEIQIHADPEHIGQMDVAIFND